MLSLKWSKVTEVAANIAIVLVAVLLAVVLVKNYLLPAPAVPSVPAGPPAPAKIANGSKLSVPSISFPNSQPTLLLAVSDTCRFCTDSADFYKQLAELHEKKKSFRFITVLPQDMERAKSYMSKLGINVDGVQSLPLDQLGVRATPTLILLDGNGLVVDSWVGKLPKDKEDAVISLL